MYKSDNLNKIIKNVDFENFSIIVHTPTGGKINETSVFAAVNDLYYTLQTDCNLEHMIKFKCEGCDNKFKINPKDMSRDRNYDYTYCVECMRPSFLYYSYPKDNKVILSKDRYYDDFYENDYYVLRNIVILHKMENVEKRKNRDWEKRKIQRSLKYWEKTIKPSFENVVFKIVENDKILDEISYCYYVNF